jgi:polyphosphate kinase
VTEFRCELLSADQLALLAAGPLPSGLSATPAARSLHRDIYFDTLDQSLRRRGVVCRMRTGADGRAILSLRIADSNGVAKRIDAPVDSGTPAEALSADNDVTRRVRGIADPATLQVRVELEVDRLTRSNSAGWLRRPRMSVHLDRITVRRNGTSANFFQLCAHQVSGSGAELGALERALEQEHGVRRSSVATHERAELALKWARLEDVPRDNTYSDRIHHAAFGAPGVAIPEFLNAELSLLAFQHRVLSLAEDASTPLRERLRFLSIVAANVDEFFMVRMAGLITAAQLEVPDDGGDGLTPAEELAAIHDLVAAIGKRESLLARAAFAELAQAGMRVSTWAELTDEQRAALRERFRLELQPLLTPFAMTLSPGHPLPRLSHLSLSMALILRHRAGGPPKFAELDLPTDAPRFFELAAPGMTLLVPLEEVVRGNLDALYPDLGVEQSHVFRVTRSAELELDEQHADDLLDEVSRATAARGQGSAVRVEVERGMPPMLRALLLEDVRREQLATGGPIVTDVDEVDGMLDLRALAQIEVPRSTGAYPPLDAAHVFAKGEPIWNAIATQDVLAHHPFESFSDSVVRFISDAANDPAVAAIKMTLYRIGSASPIADALLAAARAGKNVTAFVELKARFDEDVNVGWARALEAAGGHVVRGIVGYKNHAKVSLVVRREGTALARYVHIGTGNYNSRSGEQYTDLSLFTANTAIADDVAELFNQLTGLSEAPRRLSRELLVAPTHLLPGIVAMIDREASNARAGKPARFTAKINGLSDPDVVRALYRASQDGVEIDLVVRGICTLRPGVPGRSARIQVVSIVGRFLEHSRIYRFENGGEARYFIGSADLRPRNLRRRVELIAPIAEAAHRRRLDEILRLYLDDGTAWELTADGEYVQRRTGRSAQDVLANPG